MPKIGPYELLDPLGQGGMGQVWKARHERLDRTVALKVLQSRGPEDFARFQREARLAARLSHPNIAQIYEVGEDAREPYIAMQYVEGAPLDRSPLPLRAKVHALRDAARAVHYAHLQGVLHRDLKPANLLADLQGRGIVLDFGLAREVGHEESSLSSAGLVLGTPAYMSPEQARGDLRAVDTRSDVYGLGASLYFFLCGRAPHQGQTALEIVMRVLERDPTPPRRIRLDADRDLETIAMKAMEREPERRYPSAAVFADELDRYLAGEPIQARPASWAYRIGKRIRRNPVVWALASALFVTGIAGTAVWIQNLRRALAAEKGLRERGDRELESARRRAEAEPHYHRAARTMQVVREDRFRDVPRRPELALEVEEAASRALAVDPDFVEALHLRGLARSERAHRDDEGFRGAESDFTRALELRGSYTPALYDRGRLYMYRFFDRVMWDNLAHQDPLRSVKDHTEWKDRAKADFERARALGGEEDEQALAEVAILLAQLQFQDAAKRGAEVFPRVRRTTELRLLMAVVHLFTFQTSRAAKELDRAFADWPRYRYALLIRILLHLAFDPDYERALADLATLREDEPDSPFVLLGLGETYRRQGKTKEALACFEEIVRRTPHSHVWHAIGQIREGEKDYAAAAEAYTRSAEVAPAWSPAYLARSRMREKLGDPAGAEADLTTVFGLLEKPAPSLIRRRAALRAELGRTDEALVDYDDAFRADPNNTLAYVSRGNLFLKLQRWEEAARDFDRVVTLSPKEPQGYAGRGAARLRGGNRAGAIEDLEQAVKLGSRDPAVARLLAEARR